QHPGEDVIVPGQDESECPGGDDPGKSERQHDMQHRARAARAVDQRRLLEIERDALEKRAQQPQRERQAERGVREDQPGARVSDSGSKVGGVVKISWERLKAVAIIQANGNAVKNRSTLTPENKIPRFTAAPRAARNENTARPPRPASET